MIVLSCNDCPIGIYSDIVKAVDAAVEWTKDWKKFRGPSVNTLVIEAIRDKRAWDETLRIHVEVAPMVFLHTNHFELNAKALP